MKHFDFGNKVVAVTDTKMNNRTIEKLWYGFTANGSNLLFEEGKENTFVIGNATIPNLASDDDYAINVEKTGIAIAAKHYNGLVRGYTALLRKIKYICLDDNNESFSINCFSEQKSYKIRRRMAHYCVFPETDLQTIRNEIRLAGSLHYTHIILEFWGMFKYDCMKELAWDNGFDKETVRDLIREIREFGMEPIPFINHLGHASMCRNLSGKHTVLDQNPKLAMYFMEDGWSWNISRDKTKELLRKMRAELIEVFGEGEYFHIGCDEAYMFSADPECHKRMVEYLKELTSEIEKEGRKPMLWADMFIAPMELEGLNCIEESYDDNCYAACKNPERANELLTALSKNSILIDWQYNTKKAPVKSFLVLKEKGYTVMEAPWYKYENCKAAVDTLEECGGYGLMFTSWHYINESYGAALYTSKLFGGPKFEWSDNATTRDEVATLLRKVTFEKINYLQAGFCEHQIGYTPL